MFYHLFIPAYARKKRPWFTSGLSLASRQGKASFRQPSVRIPVAMRFCCTIIQPNIQTGDKTLRLRIASQYCFAHK